MSLYKIPSAFEEPEEVIICWSVYAAIFSDGSTSHHLIGVIPRNQHGRVTSAIQVFDRIRMQITTRSGRRYLLSDEPGQDANADYVWRQWCLANQVKSISDVTDEYLKKH